MAFALVHVTHINKHARLPCKRSNSWQSHNNQLVTTFKRCTKNVNKKQHTPDHAGQIAHSNCSAAVINTYCGMAVTWPSAFADTDADAPDLATTGPSQLEISDAAAADSCCCWLLSNRFTACHVAPGPIC